MEAPSQGVDNRLAAVSDNRLSASENEDMESTAETQDPTRIPNPTCTVDPKPCHRDPFTLELLSGLYTAASQNYPDPLLPQFLRLHACLEPYVLKGVPVCRLTTYENQQ